MVLAVDCLGAKQQIGERQFEKVTDFFARPGFGLR
jgi:hypothetical protein